MVSLPNTSILVPLTFLLDLFFFLLFFSTDVTLLADQLIAEQPLIKEGRKAQLVRLLQKLLEKQSENDQKEYGLFKVLRAHILPLTNCAFNKGGDRFITGSYDRTCKVWESATGKEVATLEGHKNVVYAISFNNPFGCVAFTKK